MRSSGVNITRLIATLALFVLGATLLCGALGYRLAAHADERLAMERRAALQSGLMELRAAGVKNPQDDRGALRELERTSGLKDLRFESELTSSGREMISVLDAEGRIVGWFSWRPDHLIMSTMLRLGPLFAAITVCLIGFCLLCAWSVRRATRDLAEGKRRALKLAHEDVLTGLPNHRRMLGAVEEAVGARKLGETVSCGLIDIDGFRDINDALGHQGGDRLLCEIAGRLRNAFPPTAIVGRFGGDDFVVVLTTPDASGGSRLIREACVAAAQPYRIDQQVEISISAGIAQTSRGVKTAGDLRRQADLALLAAKTGGRGAIVVFEPAMEAHFQERRFLERELHHALAKNALDVHYQPVVAADGRHITGVEALLRWNHPERGMIPPATFIPIAEQTGLMAEVGSFVLDRALADAARWAGIEVAINLSPVQVRDPAIVALVAGLMARHGIEPSRVILEITEGVLIDNPAEAKQRLDQLRALGIRMALDDFGTGYSSLSYLQRFAFDKLKIDKSFVAPLGRSAESGVMIQAIVALGKALGLSIVVEGVETEEQRVLLRLAGCEEMQGYLFARPAPRETIDHLLQNAAPARGAA